MKEIDVNALFCGISAAYQAVNKANREDPGKDHEIIIKISDYEKKEGKNNET